MGTIINRGTVHRAIVRKGGETHTKSFAKVGDAKLWISETELLIARRVVQAADSAGMDLGAIMTKYCKEVVEQRPYPLPAAVSHYKRFAINFDKVQLGDMDSQWWVDTVCGFKVKASSAGRYVWEIKSALNCAVDMWKVKIDWTHYETALAALKRQGKVSLAQTRKRRASPAEIDAIKACGPKGSPMPFCDILDFALATGMRCGEIFGLKWDDLSANRGRPMIWVRDRKAPKNKLGNHDHVPLLGDAYAILKRQPRRADEPRIFPFAPTVMSNNFIHARKRAQITGLHFHDLRHEAISRMFEAGYGVPEVALVSGHRNWKTLMGYTHLKGEDLHDGPMAVRRAA